MYAEMQQKFKREFRTDTEYSLSSRSPKAGLGIPAKIVLIITVLKSDSESQLLAQVQMWPLGTAPCEIANVIKIS